jgi:hypothetical protein
MSPLLTCAKLQEILEFSVSSVQVAGATGMNQKKTRRLFFIDDLSSAQRVSDAAGSGKHK